MHQSATPEAIIETFRRAAAALGAAEVPFMLGGGLACWARGGPLPLNEVDLMLPRGAATRALEVIDALGMRVEDTPEDWLVKAWDGPVIVDLIFESLGVGEITAELVEAGEVMHVMAVRVPVMSLEDVLVGKLLAISEQELSYGTLIAIARSLREQVDWRHVAARTSSSPYARAFISLLGELQVLPGTDAGHQPAADRPRVMILGPLPELTVTVEAGQREQPDIHIHAGGQGTWAARMAGLLDAEVELCCALGGESGVVLDGLIRRWGITPRSARMRSASNATYVHDRRSGERVAIAAEPEPTPTRHERDSLYTLALASGLRADVALLTGTIDDSALPEDFYRRLAQDLTRNGTCVVCDLVGRQLRGALTGGPDLVKISEHDLVKCGYASDDSADQLMDGVLALARAGAQNVVLSRREMPVLARLNGRLVEATGPRFAVADPRGTGDSQSAAIAVALASGAGPEDALRLGMAAGAVNATRMGLGSGDGMAIREHARRIQIRDVDGIAESGVGVARPLRAARL